MQGIKKTHKNATTIQKILPKHAQQVSLVDGSLGLLRSIEPLSITNLGVFCALHLHMMFTYGAQPQN
jgi:hypothetical protein